MAEACLRIFSILRNQTVLANARRVVQGTDTFPGERPMPANHCERDCVGHVFDLGSASVSHQEAATARTGPHLPKDQGMGLDPTRPGSKRVKDGVWAGKICQKNKRR